MNRIKINLGRIIKVVHSLTKKNNEEKFKEGVYGLIIREYMLSLYEDKHYVGFTVNDSFFRQQKLIIPLKINWVHLQKYFICCDHDNPKVREDAKEVLAKIREEEELKEKLSKLSWFRLCSLRRRYILVKRIKQIHNENVSLLKFVSLAVYLYVEWGLGTSGDFYNELLKRYSYLPTMKD